MPVRWHLIMFTLSWGALKAAALETFTSISSLPQNENGTFRPSHCDPL